MMRTIISNLRQLRRGEKGLAAMELALFLPMIAILLYTLVEGANTIRAYATIAEASRSAARHVVLSGEPASAPALVQNLVADLPPSALATNVILSDGNTVVTVEVSYAYHTLFNDNPLPGESHNSLYTLTARTTMPIP